MARAIATAPGSFWKDADTVVSFEEGDELDGDLAVLVLSTGTLPFIDPDAPAPVVEVVDTDTAVSGDALEG